MHTFSRFEDVGVGFMQWLSEFEVRGGDGGSVGPMERDGVAGRKVTRWLIKDTRCQAQLKGTLPDERPACRHARVNHGELIAGSQRWSMADTAAAGGVDQSRLLDRLDSSCQETDSRWVF